MSDMRARAVERALARPITRRQVLKAGAFGATAAVLAACTPAASQSPSPTSPAGSPSASASAVPTAVAPSGELKIAYGAIGPNRHPYFTAIVPDDDINNTIFDNLVTLSPKGEVLPWLAGYEQIDDVTIRFKLAKGVKFHDGRPLTAEDAKVALDRYGSEEYRGVGSALKPVFVRAAVVDDATVELVLKEPNRVILQNLGYLSHVIPKDANDPEAFARNPVGSGPYQFSEFVPNDRVVVAANLEYWGNPKPSFEKITFRVIPENSTRVAALEAREVDYIVNVPPDDVDRLRSAGFQILSIPSNRPMFVRFNFAVDGPWKDVRVRQALNYAVDKQAIVDALYGGTAAVSESVVAHGAAHFNANPVYAPDLDRARELLSDAGVVNGFSVKFATPAGRYLKDREVAEAIAGQLEQIGVRLEIVPLEFPTYLQQLRTEKDTTGRQYGMSLMAWGNLIADADFAYEPLLMGNGWNLGDYSNPDFDALAAEGQRTFDPATLKEINSEAQRLVWEDTPWIFLWDLPLVDAASADIVGIGPRPDEQHRWLEARRTG